MKSVTESTDICDSMTVKTTDIPTIDVVSTLVSVQASELWAKLRVYYDRQTRMNKQGISRNERAHSATIASFLDIKSEHGLGDYPMRRFMQLLVLIKRGNQKSNADSDFPITDLVSTIIADSYTIEDFAIHTEYPINKNPSAKVQFIDIYIEFCMVIDGERKNIGIVIENKIKSSEKKDSKGQPQTVDYAEWGRNYSKNREMIYVFLTPLPNQVFDKLCVPQCECKAYIQMNYQYLLDYMIYPCYQKCKIANNQEQDFFEDYIRTLSKPPLINEKGDIIMAVGPEELKLVDEFYEKNKDLITIILQTIANNKDNELSDEDRTQIRSAGKTIRNKTKTFDDMGIPVGTTIVYIHVPDGSIKATVVSSNKVRLNGTTTDMSISKLAGELSLKHGTKNPGSGFEAFSLEGEKETLYQRWERINIKREKEED